jgi:flagellar biosynthetic protein FliQ
MTPESVMGIAHQAMVIALLLAGPLLLTSLVVGLVVSLFQAATQINESTLTFIPKLLAVFCALVVGGPWMLHMMLDYLRQVLTNIPSLVG